MYIFSDTTLTFIKKCEHLLKMIIKDEVGLEVGHRKFKFNNYYYPYSVVVFQGGNEIGLFDSRFYQIALNQKIIYQCQDDVLKNILRHEFAHYLSFLYFGPPDKPHDKNFRSLCERYQWGKEVYAATIDLTDHTQHPTSISELKLIEKIQKLLRLASSSNPHEAEMATLKANQLLLKHHFNSDFNCDSDTPLYMKRILEQKRKDAKLIAIYDILQHFLVHPIISYGKNICCLEITGLSHHVELADYICHYLSEEFDRLWEVEKSVSKLQGLKSKNSFYLGIANGYSEKLKSSTKDFTPNEMTSLISLKNNHQNTLRKIYRSLSSSTRSSSHDKNAFNQGHKRGKNLSINPALQKSSPIKKISFS